MRSVQKKIWEGGRGRGKEVYGWSKVYNFIITMTFMYYKEEQTKFLGGKANS